MSTRVGLNLRQRVLNLGRPSKPGSEFSRTYEEGKESLGTIEALLFGFNRTISYFVKRLLLVSTGQVFG